MPILCVREGPDKGKSLPLDLEKGQLICGTGKKVVFRLTDEDVAKKHFRLIKDGDVITVYVLQGSEFSVNGSVVEEEAEVGPGDTIELGETVLAIEPSPGEEEEPAEAAAEAPKRKSKKRAKKKAKKSKKSAGKAADQPEAEQEPKAEPELGSEVAGCILEERIGEGALTIVFAARQVSMDRQVALKILRPELAVDADLAQSFLEKARLMGQVRHDTVVQVYDVGEDQGYVYMNMEFMAGGSLAELLEEEGALDWQTTLAVILDTAESLRFARDESMCHGAVTPGNILLSEEGEVKLANLGISRLANERGYGVDDPQRCRYLSPEQIQGKAGDIRSDIYALGAVFFHCLAGRAPYEGVDADAVKAAHEEETIPVLKQYCTRAPAAAGELIARMLAKRPADRFQTPDDLARELDQLDTEVDEDEAETGAETPAEAPPAAAGKRPSARGRAAREGGGGGAARSRRAGGQQKPLKPASVRERPAGMSAAERMRRLKEKREPKRTAMSAGMGIAVVVLAIIIAGIWYALKISGAGERTLARAQALHSAGKFKQAYAVIQMGRKGWDQSVIKQLNTLENELRFLIKEEQNYQECVKLWNSYYDLVKRSPSDTQEQRRRLVEIIERLRGSEYHGKAKGLLARAKRRLESL